MRSMICIWVVIDDRIAGVDVWSMGGLLIPFEYWSQVIIDRTQDHILSPTSCSVSSMINSKSGLALLTKSFPVAKIHEESPTAPRSTPTFPALTTFPPGFTFLRVRETKDMVWDKKKKESAMHSWSTRYDVIILWGEVEGIWIMTVVGGRSGNPWSVLLVIVTHCLSSGMSLWGEEAGECRFLNCDRSTTTRVLPLIILLSPWVLWSFCCCRYTGMYEWTLSNHLDVSHRLVIGPKIFRHMSSRLDPNGEWLITKP